MEGRLSPWHRRPVMVLGLVAVLFQYVDMLLCVAGFSLFLRRVGTASLPGFYVALNLASIVFMLVVLGRRRLSTFRLSLQLNLLLAGTILAAIPFLSAAPPLFFFVLFLVIRLHDILCFTYFLTYVQTVFPVREAKRQIGLILGVSSGACVLAGLSVKPLVAWLSMEALFVVAATATILLVAAQILAGRRWPPPEGRAEEERPDEDARHPLAETLAVLRRSSLAENVVKVFFLTTLLRYLIEFQYSKALVLLFPDEVELAGFVGIFKAGVSVLVTLGQLFLTHRLLARWRTGGTMALAPLLELLLCGLVLVHPAAVPVLLVQGGWTLGYHVATRPAFNLLLVPLSAAARNRVSLLSTLSGALGSLFSGLVLVVLGDALGLRPFFFVVALLYLFTRSLANRLDGDYLESLEKRITSTDVAAKLEALRALRDLGGGAHRDHLARLLSDEDPEVRLEALRHLGALAADAAETLVHGVFENEADSRIRATLARSLPEILGARAADLVLRWLGEDDDPRTRANLVEALGALGREEDGDRLLPLLENENDRIRANAATSLLQIARDDGHLRRGLEELAALARSPRSRTTGCRPRRHGTAPPPRLPGLRHRRPRRRIPRRAAQRPPGPGRAARRRVPRAPRPHGPRRSRSLPPGRGEASGGRDPGAEDGRLAPSRPPPRRHAPSPGHEPPARRRGRNARLRPRGSPPLRRSRALTGTPRRPPPLPGRDPARGRRRGPRRRSPRPRPPRVPPRRRRKHRGGRPSPARRSAPLPPRRAPPRRRERPPRPSLPARAPPRRRDPSPGDGRPRPPGPERPAGEPPLSGLPRGRPHGARRRGGTAGRGGSPGPDRLRRRAPGLPRPRLPRVPPRRSPLRPPGATPREEGRLPVALSPPPDPPPAEDSSLRAVLGAFLDASETEALLHALAPEEGTPR